MHFNEFLLPFCTQNSQISEWIPSFKDLNEYLISLLRREGRREGERQWGMPRGTWCIPTCSRSTRNQGPSIHPPFQFSAIFQIKISRFATDDILQKWRNDWPRSIWWQNWGVRSPFSQSHTPSLWLPCQPWSLGSVLFSPHSTKSGFGFYNFDFHFIFNELIYGKCLGCSLRDTKQ